MMNGFFFSLYFFFFFFLFLSFFLFFSFLFFSPINIVFDLKEGRAAMLFGQIFIIFLHLNHLG